MPTLTTEMLQYRLYTANLLEGEVVNSYIILERTSDGLVSISPNYGYTVGSLITLFQRVLDTTVFTAFDESVPYTDITKVGTFNPYVEA